MPAIPECLSNICAPLYLLRSYDAAQAVLGVTLV